MTLLLALMFFVYLVGAGTNDAAEKKPKALRRPTTTTLPPTTTLPTRSSNSANEWSTENNHKVAKLENTDHVPPESANSNDKEISEDNHSENLKQESPSDEHETTLKEETNNSNKPKQENEKSKNNDNSNSVPESILHKENTSDKEQKNLEAVISEAIEDLSVAEEEIVQENQSILTDTLKHFESTLRVGLKRIFANFQDVSSTEMDEIVKEVSNELELEIYTEFKKTADALTDAKAKDIGDVAEIDEEFDYNVTTIQGDIKQVEESSIQDLKNEIDQAAQDMKVSMKKKAQKIEMEVIQKAIANKERKKYHRVKPIDTKEVVASESSTDDQDVPPEDSDISTETSDVPPPETMPEVDKERLEQTIKDAIIDFDETEEDSIHAHDSDLGEALKNIETMLTNSLGDLFGSDDDISAAEIKSIANEVSINLERHVKSKFRKAADSLALSKAIEIENIVEDDEEKGINAKSIVSDVIQVERTEVEKLKQEIDIAAEDVKHNMKKEAAHIEQDIIEKALANRKRKKYHNVKIVNDKVEIAEEVTNEIQREEKENGKEENVNPGDSNTVQDKNEEKEKSHEGDKEVSSSRDKSNERGDGEAKKDSRSKRDESEGRSESEDKEKKSPHDGEKESLSLSNLAKATDHGEEKKPRRSKKEEPEGDKKDSSSKDAKSGAVDDDENENSAEDESSSE